MYMESIEYKKSLAAEASNFEDVIHLTQQERRYDGLMKLGAILIFGIVISSHSL